LLNQQLPKHINERIDALLSETLLDLLIGQCTDLQSLLVLARRETDAAERDDFDQLLEVAGERASLGERLETYHRQITELRDKLGEKNGLLVDHALVKEGVQLALNIREQDSQTTSLLLAARTRIGEAIARLGQSQRHSLAYLQNESASGLNCDRRA
jgi:hypothetical protein